VFIPMRTIALCILVLSELTALGASAAAQGPTAEQLYNEANGAYDCGDVLRAISLYQQVITLQPDSVPARTNLALALAHDGRYQEAIAQYQEALKCDPKNSMVRLNLALAWYKQTEFEKASAELESLRTEHTDSRESLYPLDDCYLRLGKTRMPAIKTYFENHNQKPQIFVRSAPVERILSTSPNVKKR
jgi:tetratricopeptide (TPR) repeat protein